MHDIAILGQMRSGSTYAFSYISDRLRIMNVEHARLDELFNPWAKWIISDNTPVFIDGANHDNLERFDLDERISMWDMAGNAARLLKHLVMVEADNHKSIKHIMRSPCTWLLMERDPVEQCLSLLVAVKTWEWNIWSDSDLSQYKRSLEPFVADLKMVERYIREVHLLGELKELLYANGQHLHVIRYESILEDCDRAGSALCMASDISWPDPSIPASAIYSPPMKLLSLDEKRHLIKNLDDVMWMLTKENIL